MPEAAAIPETDNALRPSRAQTRRVAVGCAVALATAAAWAFFVPDGSPMDLPRPVIATASTEPSPPPIALSAFQVPVWANAEPVAPKQAPVPPPLPPPPLKVQLIGIIRESDTYKAVLYDPNDHKVRVVTAGETVQGCRIEQVESGTVSIRNGSVLQVLALKNQGGSR